jgi:cephalosporin hydroxylase
MLALLDHCGDSALGFPNRKVVGIDIDIRSHNRIEIEAHPLSKYIELIEGSSVSKEVVGRVNQLSLNRTNVMVILDSNHSHEHVLQELKLYSPLVTLGSYCVVFDTIVEYFSPEDLMGRPWGPGNSPLSAVTEFLKENRNFQIDSALSGKLALTVAPSGYLRRLY